jgi:hypothetical protein
LKCFLNLFALLDLSFQRLIGILQVKRSLIDFLFQLIVGPAQGFFSLFSPGEVTEDDDAT